MESSEEVEVARSASDVLQELAIARAAEKVLSQRVKDLRREADALLMEANEALGSKDAELSVYGVKVGKLSVAKSSPGVYVEDEREYQAHLAWLFSDGDERVKVFYEAPELEATTVAREIDGGRYAVFDAATGEEVPGLAYRPGGARVYTTISGCSPEKVAEALATRNLGLPDALKTIGGM